MARKLGKAALLVGVASVTAWAIAGGVHAYRKATAPVSWDFGW